MATLSSWISSRQESAKLKAYAVKANALVATHCARIERAEVLSVVGKREDRKMVRRGGISMSTGIEMSDQNYNTVRAYKIMGTYRINLALLHISSRRHSTPHRP